MDRSASHQLNPLLARRRADALAIAAGAVAAVSPRLLMPRVASALRSAGRCGGAAVHVVAAGKAAAGMFEAFAAAPPCALSSSVVIGPQRPAVWTAEVPFIEAGHPFATARSVEGAMRALEVAAKVPPDGCLVCLLSGGASALMAAPLPGLSLPAKQEAVSHVMRGGADITALNAVRKHLSCVKGGRLAAACRGEVVTFAISDVIGDDLSVIGSGPCVADWSTWDDAIDAVRRFGGWDGLAAPVRAMLEAGRRGDIPDTPKAGDARLSRARAEVIGGRRQAMEGAGTLALTLGYEPVTLDAPVTGEARVAAHAWWDLLRPLTSSAGRPLAIISSGETTVRVRGAGRGGRNQEFALALADRLAGDGAAAVLASVGTDGIDGPTDAAGALIDQTSSARAAALGLEAGLALDANDSYSYFAALGDLVHTGPSGTNVGDLQVLLVGPA